MRSENIYIIAPWSQIKIFHRENKSQIFFRLRLGAHKSEINFFFSGLSAVGKCILYGTVKDIAYEALGEIIILIKLPWPVHRERPLKCESECVAYARSKYEPG